MVRMAVARLWAGLTLVLGACGGGTADDVSFVSSPSPLLLATPTWPTALPTSFSVLPTEPAPLFPIPPEYAAMFELAGAVHGWDRLIQRIRIPAIGIDSMVVPVGWRVDGEGVVEWDSPGPYVGWAVSSVLPDEDGNVVFYGHNNIEGGVFRHLYRLVVGQEVVLVTGRGEWRYLVESVDILAVEESEAARQTYAQYLGEMFEPRVTLLSCYPPEGNTHRVLVVTRAADAR